MPSIRSGWTADRQCMSIMIATACSVGCPSPSWTARLTACTAVGELLAIFSAIRRAASSSSSRGWSSLTMPSRCASWAVIGSPVISICRALPGGSRRGSRAGEPPPAARPIIASGWPKRALSDAMMKSVLWAISQPPPGVEGAVEVLALPQPLLLGHVLALAQVAADREGPLAGAGDDGDAHAGTDRDRLQDLGQPRPHLRGDGVVGVRPVQGDDRHAPVGAVLDQHG